jgi:hypothetical protein
MSAKITKEKEFIKDALEFLNLKYNFTTDKVTDENQRPYENVEDVFYRVLDEYIFKKLYKIGVEDYKIDFSYQEFLSLIKKGGGSRGFGRGFRFSRFNGGSRYIKKSNHKKKEINLTEVDKRLWKRRKIKKRSCYSRHYYDYDWETRKFEKNEDLYAKNDLYECLEESDLDVKSLRLKF